MSENQMFSEVFRGYRNGKLAWNDLMYFLSYLFCEICNCSHIFPTTRNYNQNYRMILAGNEHEISLSIV